MQELPILVLNSTSCFESASRSYTSLALGIILTLGTFLSYLPQHISLLRSRSSKGLSWPWIFIANVATFSLLIGILCLSWNELVCCNSLPFLGCQSILLPVYQVATGWINMFPIFIMYVIFQQKDDKEDVPSFVAKHCKALKSDTIVKRIFFLFCFCFALPSLVVAAFLVGFTGKSTATVTFGSAYGIISTVATIIMWLPQIILTYRKRDPGSLSLLMLLLQFPGGVAAVYFQAIMEQESFTTWSPYLASALEQLILIILIVYYKFKRSHKTPKARKYDDLSWTTEAEEEYYTDTYADAFANDFVSKDVRNKAYSDNEKPKIIDEI